MYRSRAVRRMGALLALALAAACGDGVTEGTPGQPGGGTPPPDTTSVVATVEITPGTLQLRVDSSRALSATVRSQKGDVLTGRLVSWTSSDPTVVRVDINGNVTALKVGTSVITAGLDGRQGHSTIEVLPPPSVATVTIVGETAGLEPGESRLLGVQLRAANGQVLYGREVTWSTSDSTVVRVLPGGYILGVKGGTATITATSEGKSGSITIIIPQWLQFDLHTSNAQALPMVLEASADTTDRTEHGMVVNTYRLRLVWGRLWLSSIDSRYRQRYDVQLWKQSTAWINGNAIAGQEELIETRVIRDEGRAQLYDMWTGEPIYESDIFGGHSFRVYQTEGRGRLISQRIPGTTEASFDLRFRK